VWLDKANTFIQYWFAATSLYAKNDVIFVIEGSAMGLSDRITHTIAGAIFAAAVLIGGGRMSMATAQQMQPLTVSAFLANPEQLLQQYPNAGRQLVGVVEQLALSDATTFKVLIGLLANANEQQKGAIGEGLARAAKTEVSTNQTLAADWQQQIAAVTDLSFQTAATNALGDVQLGAIGGGPLGAVGGGGGQTNPFNQGPSNNGLPPQDGSNPKPTPSFTFSSGTTLAITTAGNSVSP
jgi:hypothetical protein